MGDRSAVAAGVAVGSVAGGALSIGSADGDAEGRADARTLLAGTSGDAGSEMTGVGLGAPGRRVGRGVGGIVGSGPRTSSVRSDPAHP
jgi:hypothetical protein